MMDMQGFLGPMTLVTVAGVQPMGSVFSTVPSANYLLGRDLPRLLPPARQRSTARTAEGINHLSPGALPCGCGA
jgi:hypothetical protein